MINIEKQESGIVINIVGDIDRLDIDANGNNAAPAKHEQKDIAGESDHGNRPDHES